MAGGIRITVDDTEVSAKLDRVPGAAGAEVKRIVTADTLVMKSYVQRRLSGEVLNVRSGRLRRSIDQRIEEQPGTVSGIVFSSSDVRYARIHEYGGKINIPEIVPVNGKVLRFEYQGRVIFAARVRAHTVTMPERPYMRPSLKEVTAKFLSDMRAVPAKVAKA